MMKTFMLFVCAILAATMISCGTPGSPASGSSENNLTSDEINRINTTLMDAVNEAGAGGSQTGAPNLLQATPMRAITYASTCDSTHYQFTAAINNTHSCPTAGHITYTGNLRTYCSSWQWHTNPTYCTCNGDWNTSNAMTFEFGDRTNNLNDCENAGLIIDGTVYVNASGKGSAVNMSITGTLSANRRGPSGGLVPLNSCNINMYYTSSTAAWSGTICGRAVH